MVSIVILLHEVPNMWSVHKSLFFLPVIFKKAQKFLRAIQELFAAFKKNVDQGSALNYFELSRCFAINAVPQKKL